MGQLGSGSLHHTKLDRATQVATTAHVGYARYITR